MRDHSYWPIVSDVINVFSHRRIVVDYFLSNRDLLSYWAKIIACFQGKETERDKAYLGKLHG